MAELLKSRLAAGKPLIGTFVKTPSPMVSEVLGKTDLDLVCLDAEHSPFDRLVQDQCLHALAAAGMPALVRVPSAAHEHILNALDCGASGVVIPHVTSAKQARDLVKAVHFGSGGRGYAGSTRAAGYTTTPMQTHLQASAAQSVLVVQIEDVEAVDAIDEIAAVEGVDCLFIGRIDLTVALGAASPDDPVVVEAVERICKSAVAAGRPVGMFLSNIAELDRWQAQGASLFLLSSDHGFLLQGAAKLTAQFRGSD
jgi:2-keto-3-deoxy-L-rhamnonate aldolase RhmA